MKREHLNVLEDPEKALEFVRNAAVESMKVHALGLELKTSDRVTAAVANGTGYRKAVAAMHKAEQTVEEVE
jgi:hypothetical protein